MSMNETPRESGADGTSDATAQTLKLLSRQEIHGELGEIFAIAEVLLGCEGQFFEMHSSFAAVFGTMVSRIRHLERALGAEGGRDD